MSDTRRWSITVYGVNGYTGQLVIDYLGRKIHTDLEKSYSDINVCIAGRNAQKLKLIVTNLREKYPLLKIDTYTCDLDDTEKLNLLCVNTYVMISCAGPYKLFGEKIIRACVTNGTNYLDLNAEIDWAIQMRSKYNSIACSKKLLFIMSLGYDFILNEMILLYILQFKAEKHKPESELTNIIQGVDHTTKMISGGTIRSGLNYIKRMGILNTFKWYFNPYRYCKDISKIDENAIQYNKNFIVPRKLKNNKWCYPFVMSPFASKYIHWLNETELFFLGNKLKFTFGETTNNWFVGLMRSILILFQLLITMLLARFTFLQIILPSPGEGSQITAKSYIFCDTEFTIQEKVDDHQIREFNYRQKSRYTKGECYKFSAMTIVEAALLLVLDSTNPKSSYGFQPPYKVLGFKYLGNLKHAGFIMDQIEPIS